MLTDTIKRFEESQPGTTSFMAFADGCLATAEQDSENAAALILLAMAAREFVDQVQDQPLSLPEAEAGRDRLIGQARKVAASANGDAGEKLAVANRIALDQIGQSR
ncbi:hypothetical protein [Fodinicurvata sp. EGI_FJ10296]|uniref:hypothetical protein n=1 Tax=Fodinicurvata sp. EGI_FJ10296 TaxID=3231908 RepID=UPI003455305C